MNQLPAITTEDVHQMLGERDIALHLLRKQVEGLTAANQRLQAEKAEAVKTGPVPVPSPEERAG